MNTPRITVSLTSDANFLALNILESLLSKNCQVIVVTNETQRWQKITEHLASRSRIYITDGKNSGDLSEYSYSIFCGGFIEKENAYQLFRKFNSTNKPSVKRLAILPFERFSSHEDSLIRSADNLSIIYMGDLVGARVDLGSDLLMSRAISEVLSERKLTIAVGEVFYPIFVSDAAKAITKWLFSFGPYGKTIFLLGQAISATDFWAVNQKIVSGVKLNLDNEIEPRSVPKNFEVRFLPININFALTQTYQWLSQPARQKPIVRRPVKKIKYPKYLFPVLISTIVILILPVLLILAGGGLLFLSSRDLVSGRTSSTTDKILIAKTLFALSRGESGIFSHVPMLGLPYKETEFVSNLGQKLSDMAVSGVPVAKAASGIFNNMLGDAVYDPTPASLEISTGMDSLFQDVSVIEAETLSARDSGVLSAKILLSKVNFDKSKNYFEQGQVLASQLPSLLGKDKRQTYLVLFENNMELRPTGGFIGSFGLMTFDGGRMTDLAVSDVYSADGQLRGHVEPPEPIKTYLNEANWWLRDSNWDPDFPTSARRAEWFLDKEVSQEVDGVIAIDLKPIVDSLKVTGPIFLADYNLDISSDNLYQKTQAESTKEFFPGSRQKASFLTALSRNLISVVEKLGEKQKFFILASLLKNFEDRHIQAFLHDEPSQVAVSTLGWGGEVAAPTCGQSCYADLVGIVEANLGVNKSNFFITRNVQLQINLDKNVITRKVSLSLKNSANTDLGPSGIYKAYVRTFIPEDAILVGAKAISGESSEDLPVSLNQSHGRQEAGVYIEVLGGQTKEIEFIWQTDLQGKPSPGSYGLYIRKQAGVGDDPWQITINSTNPALTKGRVYTYNTVLARDYFLRLK